MSELSSTQKTHTQAWENYWRGSIKAGTVDSGGAQDPALNNFWTAFFTAELAKLDGASLLDVGCGSGAVTNIVLRVTEQKSVRPNITCLDSSSSAIKHIKQQFPDVSAIQASAACTSFPDGFFDYIVSQFGLEYAGMAARSEVARLLRNGGTIVLVMHLQGGAIDKECTENEKAIDLALASGLLPNLINVFTENMAIRKGQGSKSKFELADNALTPCIKSIEAIFARYGKSVAGGIIYKIYADTAHMCQKMYAFEPSEVIDWAKRVEQELTVFSQRMASMKKAAMSAAEVKQAVANFSRQGIEITSQETLNMGQPGEPAAWILRGHRKVVSS